MYYYTSIRGSKPIKDPRIGAYFGSQRHKFKSLQLLEQETAIHGNSVYAVDGREWCRLVGTYVLQNNDQGNVPYLDTSGTYIEITGYFSEANLISLTYSSGRDYKWKIDGGSYSSDKTDFDTVVNSPLTGRYVDAGSVANIGISQTLGIHTLRIESTGDSEDPYVYGVELIAQDTTSDANKLKIQIPAQNVVSFGKKFPISATATHYDPFNGFTNGTTTFGTKVDTATSLGLGEGTTYGAPWAISSSNHIRPFNGGRVVKWVDSDGTIKTSVTMMPRNAQNIGNNANNGSAGTPSNEITPASATNTHTINFSDDIIDNSLAEVAHTFRGVEFGNGSANGSTSYKDFTVMQQFSDSEHSYVMDDGLTSFAGIVRGSADGFYPDAATDSWYLTFIGTGLSIEGLGGTRVLAQNLPYGTHIFRYYREDVGGSTSNPDIIIDGISLGNPALGN